MSLVLGVDGGGTKTRALVCTMQGDAVAVGEGPSSNPASVGFERATAALIEAVAKTGVSTAGFEAACFGIAGVDREEDRAGLERWVTSRRFAARAFVVHDSDVVLAAGASDEAEPWGLGLICGTGSVGFGRSRGGLRARAGGLGWLLDDDGSGYGIAVDALRAAARTADGRAAANALLAALLEAWDLERADDLAAHVYRLDVTRADIAALAPIVLRLAEAGDPDAYAIATRAADAAALLVTTVANKLREPDAPVALAGGLLVRSAGYRAAVLARLERAGIAASRTRLVEDPARGAVALAVRSIRTSRTRARRR